MKTLEKFLAYLLFVSIIVFASFYEMYKDEKRDQIASKGKYFDLRGGSIVVDVSDNEKVVWFQTLSDSTYFYEPFSKLGIE